MSLALCPIPFLVLLPHLFVSLGFLLHDSGEAWSHLPAQICSPFTVLPLSHLGEQETQVELKVLLP